MDKVSNYLAINRQSWNNRTESHINSAFYNMEQFMKKTVDVAPKKFRIAHLDDKIPMVYAVVAKKKNKNG